VANGAPNIWGEVNGKLTPYFETEGYKKTLDFFKDMYNKGYMNEDFYLIKGNDKYSPMLAGKAGMMMTSATNAASPGGKFDPLTKENPNAKIAYTNTFVQADGTPITNSLISVGAIGGLVFPK
jgi:putative aldouronate transport system substrate-binding protein